MIQMEKLIEIKSAIENFNQIIRDLAMENFTHYPECYPIKNGLATDEASENAQDLAKGYYENRTESEIERDDKLGVDFPDYVEAVMSAFSSFVQNGEQ